MIADQPLLLTVRKDMPANNLPEFIAYARANQKTMQYGSAGVGSATHLGCILFNAAIGVDITHVPYRGGAPAMTDLIAGRIDYWCPFSTTAMPQIASGKLRALATANDKRSSVLPEVPTMAESGVKNCEAGTTTALMGPAGMARDIITKLNSATNKALATNATRDRFHALGTEVLGGSAAENDARIKAEFVKWHKVAKAANIKLE